MKSEDELFTDAIFVEKAKARVASVRRPAANKENVNVNGEESEESSDEEASYEDSDVVSDSHETDEESNESNEPDSHQDSTEKNKDDVKLIPLRFEEVKVNSWVLVLYEQERFLGRCLGKAGGGGGGGVLGPVLVAALLWNW